MQLNSNTTRIAHLNPAGRIPLRKCCSAATRATILRRTVNLKDDKKNLYNSNDESDIHSTPYLNLHHEKLVKITTNGTFLMCPKIFAISFSFGFIKKYYASFTRAKISLLLCLFGATEAASLCLFFFSITSICQNGQACYLGYSMMCLCALCLCLEVLLLVTTPIFRRCDSVCWLYKFGIPVDLYCALPLFPAFSTTEFSANKPNVLARASRSF